MDKSSLSLYVPEERVRACDEPRTRHRPKLSRGLRVVLGFVLSLATLQCLGLSTNVWRAEERIQVPLRAAEWLDKCQLLDVPSGPAPHFHSRKVSDRFVPGTKPTLITVMYFHSLQKALWY